MSFDPFDAGVKVSDDGAARHIALPVSAIAAGFVLFTVLLLIALAAAGPGELAPMQFDLAQLWRAAEEGRFPLVAAAAEAEHSGLAIAAKVQTFVLLALLLGVAGHFSWRGYTSEYPRGWSNGLWMGGVLLLCLAPRVFDDFTFAGVDFAFSFPLATIAGEEQHALAMSPVEPFVLRGVAGALALALSAVFFHDVGYRLRESLEDFHLVEADVRRHAEPKMARQSASASARAHAEEATGGFGQRSGRPPPPPPQSADARARAVLGVAPSASRREIERAYRAQMKRAHPDHGGSVERAAALNAARDALLRRG